MAKYIRKAMSIGTFKITQCKLAPTVTFLCTRNFACTNVCAKPFYVHENQCTQILNLSSPEHVICNITYLNLWANWFRNKCYIQFSTSGTSKSYLVWWVCVSTQTVGRHCRFIHQHEVTVCCNTSFDGVLQSNRKLDHYLVYHDLIC